MGNYQASPVEPVYLLKTGKKPLTPPEQKSKDSVGTYRCGRGRQKHSLWKFCACHACGKLGNLKHMCKTNRTQGTIKTVENTSITISIVSPGKCPYVVVLTVEGK